MFEKIQLSLRELTLMGYQGFPLIFVKYLSVNLSAVSKHLVLQHKFSFVLK